MIHGVSREKKRSVDLSANFAQPSGFSLVTKLFAWEAKARSSASSERKLSFQVRVTKLELGNPPFQAVSHGWRVTGVIG